MIHLIVASHGPLSASIVKSASLIAGSSSIADIKTISCYKALQKKVNPAIIMVLILALGVILKAFNII